MTKEIIALAKQKLSGIKSQIKHLRGLAERSNDEERQYKQLQTIYSQASTDLAILYENFVQRQYDDKLRVLRPELNKVTMTRNKEMLEENAFLLNRLEKWLYPIEDFDKEPFQPLVDYRSWESRILEALKPL
jgi:hypothetical protein